MPDMMIVNVPPWQGEYEFELGEKPLSPVEWRWLKKISGYLPLTIDEGWKGGDPDLFLAFAVIAMRRAGKIAKDAVLETAAELEEAPFDGTAITFRGEVEAEEEEADPQTDDEPSDSTPSTGDDSEPPSEPSPESETQKTSGIQDWVTGAGSDRPTLVTSR